MDNQSTEHRTQSTEYRTQTKDESRRYNHEHHHSALGLLMPAVVHYGQAAAVLEQRQGVLQAACATHLERSVQGPPVPAGLPAEVRIYRPHTVLELRDDAHQSFVLSYYTH